MGRKKKEVTSVEELDEKESKPKRKRRTKKQIEHDNKKKKEPPKLKKNHFKERCDICGKSYDDFRTFFDEENQAHIICYDCISIIKGL
jgi:hypothetical protein